ncbi:MAG TPA: HD domain-containing phosphohydrolase [Solirubrobacteraceae bacterium]|jgi:HD-GYP domain-containing protein (c-di-GMP phosphodiesterase class II)|nr:HD domain-containing phosphohydrolase [Solirubrobacteraceae bacterium]
MEDITEPARRVVVASELVRAIWARERNLGAVECALVSALREFDTYTADHCDETVELATLVAVRLGADRETVELVERVARLHDIGKLGVPIKVLLKPGPLDARETELMRAHTEIGERILSAVPALAEIARAVRHEHERWDGSGYPDGIAGEAIPFASRIVFACDAWHAMTSRRPYRLPLPYAEALWELESGAGNQFDPGVAAALLGLLATDDERAA